MPGLNRLPARSREQLIGNELSLQQFTFLVEVASRHHRKQIAGWVSLTAHTRAGRVYFKASDGHHVLVDEVHRACKADDEVQRWAYTLYMHYAHFG